MMDVRQQVCLDIHCKIGRKCAVRYGRALNAAQDLDRAVNASSCVNTRTEPGGVVVAALDRFLQVLEKSKIQQ